MQFRPLKNAFDDSKRQFVALGLLLTIGLLWGGVGVVNHFQSNQVELIPTQSNEALRYVVCPDAPTPVATNTPIPTATNTPVPTATPVVGNLVCNSNCQKIGTFDPCVVSLGNKYECASGINKCRLVSDNNDQYCGDTPPSPTNTPTPRPTLQNLCNKNTCSNTFCPGGGTPVCIPATGLCDCPGMEVNDVQQDSQNKENSLFVANAQTNSCDFYEAEGIQQAIDAVPNNTQAEIFIKYGTYEFARNNNQIEGLVINDKIIDFVGESRTGVVMERTSSMNSSAQPLFDISGGSEVSFEKMTMRDSKVSSIVKMNNNSDLEVTNVFFYNVNDLGNRGTLARVIDLADSSNAIIQRSRFYNANYQNIILRDNSNLEIEQSLVIGGHYGIQANNSANIKATNNVFDRNDIAVYLDNSGGTFDGTNNIFSNSFHVGLYASRQNQVTESSYTIYHNNAGGINSTHGNFVTDTSDNRFIGVIESNPLYQNYDPNDPAKIIDFRLESNSPGIDTGNPLIFDAGDNTRSDIGAWGGIVFAQPTVTNTPQPTATNTPTPTATQPPSNDVCDASCLIVNGNDPCKAGGNEFECHQVSQGINKCRLSANLSSEECELSIDPVCDTGQVECNGQCVNLQDDRWNCGACGNACGDEQSCDAGQCIDGPPVCTPEQSICNNQCTDLQNDDNNCGTCGNSCGSGFFCSAGSCVEDSLVCIGTLTECNGQCVDLQADNNNCGGCGIQCASFQGCHEGICHGIGPGETKPNPPQYNPLTGTKFVDDLDVTIFVDQAEVEQINYQLNGGAEQNYTSATKPLSIDINLTETTTVTATAENTTEVSNQSTAFFEKVNVGLPTNMTVSCSDVGVGTFDWNEASNAQAYLLRINKDGAFQPNDPSTGDKFIYTQGTTVVLTGFEPSGSYESWSVQPLLDAENSSANFAVTSSLITDAGNFNCDEAAPNIPIVDPLPNKTFLETINISGTKPANTELWVNGVKQNVDFAGITWEIEVDLTNIGINSFEFYTVSSADQESARVPIAIERCKLADLNCDGVVNIIDFPLFKEALITFRQFENGEITELTELNFLADFDSNGRNDVGDFDEFKDAYIADLS